jgi:hypothetical protein
MRSDFDIRWLIALLVTAAAALVSPAEAQSATGTAGRTSPPTAAEIIARATKAIDPSGSLAKHTSSHASVSVELVGAGISGTGENYAARPNKLYTRTALGPIGVVETGHDGVVGWLSNPSTGPALMDSAQLSRLRQINAFDYWQHKPEIFRTISAPTSVEFQGRPSYKIHFMAKDGWEYDEYFDVDTGFRRGLQYVDRSNGNSTTITIVLDNYAPFGGAMLPGTVTQRTPSLTLVQRTLRVEFDVTPDSIFALPPAIRALVTK